MANLAGQAADFEVNNAEIFCRSFLNAELYFDYCVKKVHNVFKCLKTENLWGATLPTATFLSPRTFVNEMQ